jgi:endosialidase-like protein
MKKRNSTFITILLVLGCVALSATADAQKLSPAPDGGYRNETTAEGNGALFSLTTGFGNTALGFNALHSNTEGSYNTASGRNALLSNTTGNHNTATGGAALLNNTDGTGNTATGRAAMGFGTTGSQNTATGWQALFNNTSDNNTAHGAFALFSNTTGEGNIALGAGAGDNLTTGDNNIDIGNEGVVDEASTIRIGTSGDQTKTFIAGISGTAVAGATVHVNGDGQLGVAPSSERFKVQVKPMDKASEAILAFKPVTFRYKHEIDPNGISQFGLIAEEVAKVNPDLVARDAEGKVYTVRYEAVNAMLLNEFLKEHQKVQKLEATAAAQHHQIKLLAAGLREQTSQIEKVKAQLTISKSVPQIVVNNQ